MFNFAVLCNTMNLQCFTIHHQMILCNFIYTPKTLQLNIFFLSLPRLLSPQTVKFHEIYFLQDSKQIISKLKNSKIRSDICMIKIISMIVLPGWRAGPCTGKGPEALLHWELSGQLVTQQQGDWVDRLIFFTINFFYRERQFYDQRQSLARSFLCVNS